MRRFEVGPVLVTLGALLLLVSLFLDWYEPGLTAWTAFEIVDLLLAVLAIAAASAAIGLLVPDAALLERRWVAPLVIAALVLAAAQLLDPPPAAGEEDPPGGGWRALASALLMALGAVLTFGRVSFAVTVEGRDPVRRVAAVDARGGARGGVSTAPFSPFDDEEPAGERGRSAGDTARTRETGDAPRVREAGSLFTPRADAPRASAAGTARPAGAEPPAGDDGAPRRTGSWLHPEEEPGDPPGSRRAGEPGAG